MARKPIDQEVRGLQTPRERIWASIKALAGQNGTGTFTRMQIQDGAEPMVRYTAVEDFAQALQYGGYLERVGGGAKVLGNRPTEVTWRLTPKGHAQGEAPLIRADGSPALDRIGTLAMWRSMKVLPTFNFHTIASAASLGDCIVKPATAKSYLKALDRAGYLGVVRPGKPGTATVFRLTRNTGPAAPAITRAKVVFDRNTGELAQADSAQEVCDALAD